MRPDENQPTSRAGGRTLSPASRDALVHGPTLRPSTTGATGELALM